MDAATALYLLGVRPRQPLIQQHKEQAQYDVEQAKQRRDGQGRVQAADVDRQHLVDLRKAEAKGEVWESVGIMHV